jgi:hypothetical protein
VWDLEAFEYGVGFETVCDLKSVMIHQRGLEEARNFQYLPHSVNLARRKQLLFLEAQKFDESRRYSMGSRGDSELGRCAEAVTLVDSCWKHCAPWMGGHHGQSGEVYSVGVFLPSPILDESHPHHQMNELISRPL